MTQPDQERPIGRHEPEWLLSPGLHPAARQQLQSLLDSERLTPEVADLFAKFMKDLRQIEKAAVSAEPCPMLAKCIDYHGPCSQLTWCRNFSFRVAL